MLLAGFFGIERFVRRGKDTKNMNRTDHDKGTTTVISIVMGMAFILLPVSPFLNWLGIGAVLILWIAVFGVSIGIVGLAIRYAAFTTLGRFFSRTLREAENHTLITNGIYKYVRHPGYLSDLLIFIGVALAMNNIITMIIIPITFTPAYAYRIHIEEKMLIKIFGKQYCEYQKTSKRLIPFIL
jgi:protein-S-isoprenylcysteine O-methyltransferase Ste14